MAVAPVLALWMTVTADVAWSADVPDSLTETCRDWTVRCVTPVTPEIHATARVCEMMQERFHQESGQRILTAALRPTEDGASLTLVAPFGLLLDEGLGIAVDGTDLAEARFRTCLPGGCLSVVALDQARTDRLIAGQVATVRMRDTDGKDVSLTIPLTGFAAAWNRLKDL